MEDQVKQVIDSMDSAKEYSRKDIERLCGVVLNVDHGDAYKVMRKVILELVNVRRGHYMVANCDSAPIEPVVKNVVEMPKKEAPLPQPKKFDPISGMTSLIPNISKDYVSWGNYKLITQLIESQQFIPSFVTGPSGNGKTMMISQACAKLGREMIRVQITPETDEDDLLGGFRLIDGNTVFEKGPVIVAMERGAILLLDEMDRGSNRLMALQGVLEGEPVLLKKTQEVIVPSPGFNIIATANTKGQGSEDGKFIAATVIDEAFLERFTLTIEQPWPIASVEQRILKKHMNKYGAQDNDSFVDRLVIWANSIRKQFDDGQIEEVISTRRLCHIIQTFSIIGDEVEAVSLCLNRFDADTAAAIKSYYTKLVEVNIEANSAVADPVCEENPF